MKKLLVLAISLLMIFSIVGCNSDDTKTNSKPESKPESKSESIVATKEIETTEDLLGVWKVTQPWPYDEIVEFGQELELEDFKTSAVYEWYIELNNDGKTTYVIDYELNKKSREKTFYTLIYEVLTEAKKVLPEETFSSIVKNHNTYNCYTEFLKGEIPDIYVDSENYEGYKAFFEEARKVMQAHTDSSIEEQAALGYMWSKLLEDVGTRFVYKDGEWKALGSVVYDWSFEDGTFRYGGMKHELEGNTEEFTMDGEFFKDSTWTRVK